MKKIFFPLLAFSLFLSGCVSVETTPDSPETSSPLIPSASADSPLEVLFQEGFFQEDTLPMSTELHLEKMQNSEEASQLKATLKLDGFMDDSVKGETYELILKKQDDGTWTVSEKKLIDQECYRGEVDGLCV